MKERNQSASRPYGWKITAFIPIDDTEPTKTVSRRLKQIKLRAAKWLIILQGGVLDVPQAQAADLPTRFCNPWEISQTMFDHQVQEPPDLNIRGALNPPAYTRMSRRHLSIETLNYFRIDCEFDAAGPFLGALCRGTAANYKQDPDFVLIKRWVPEWEQDLLWNHTPEIRDRRHRPPVLAIEMKAKHTGGEIFYETYRSKDETPRRRLARHVNGNESDRESETPMMKTPRQARTRVSMFQLSKLKGTWQIQKAS